MKEFTPMGDIPSLGKLTVYMGEANNLNKDLLQDFIQAIEDGNIKLNIDRTYKLDQMVVFGNGTRLQRPMWPRRDK